MADTRTDTETIVQAGPAMSLIVFVAVVSMILWGGTPAATRYAVTGFDPVMAAVMRTTVAALLSVPIILLAKLPAPSSRHQWLLAAISGLCCFALFPTVLGFGIARTSTGHAALIIAMGPIVTGLLAAALARTLPGRHWWSGTAIAVAGVVLLVSESSSTSAQSSDVIGDLLCILGMCIVAIGYIAGGKLSAEQNAFGVTCWGLIIAGIAMAPILFLQGGSVNWTTVEYASWGGVAYLAVVSSVIGYAGFFWALDRGGVMRISPIQYLVPVVGVIFGCLLFDETFTLIMFLSATAIIGGIAFARRT